MEVPKDGREGSPSPLLKLSPSELELRELRISEDHLDFGGSIA